MYLRKRAQQSLSAQNAPSYETAQAVAKSIANSSLFKTAMYGEGETVRLSW